jgi:hypothetical protein
MWVNPQLFAGMNFQQLMQMANDSGRNNRVSVETNLETLSRQTQFQNKSGQTLWQGQTLSDPAVRQRFNDQILSDMARLGVDQKTQQGIINKYGLSDNPGQVANEIRDVQRIIQRQTNKDIRNANIKTNVEISLAPDARRIITATLKGQNYDTTDPTNSSNWTADVGGAIDSAWNTGLNHGLVGIITGG